MNEHSCPWRDIAAAQKNEIHHLRAEVEALRRSRDGWQEEARVYCQNATHQREKRESAEAEVGRLTEQDGAMLRNTMEALHAAEAERDDLLGALREPMALCEKHLGCGDHSCRFVTPKGMATNGGCRCKDRPYVMPALEALFKAARAALAPEETTLDDTGREEFRAGVLAAANYVCSISVPGRISAQFILDLAAGIRALPTPGVEDDECGFCLRPMRERNTKCLLCSPPAPEERGEGRCMGCDYDGCEWCGAARLGRDGRKEGSKP